MTHEAEVRGLDKEEKFQQMLAYARMQILTQQLTRRVQQEAARFLKKIWRLLREESGNISGNMPWSASTSPRLKQEPPPGAKLSEEAEKERQKNAEERDDETGGKRCAHEPPTGSRLPVLQKEAYQSAGMKSNPPNASMGKIRRTGLPAGARRQYSA